jgi:hypothetical protein
MALVRWPFAIITTPRAATGSRLMGGATVAEKGARARLEPVAFRMYAEGQTLESISSALGVSRQSLSQWKSATLRPGDEFDAWDMARQNKFSRIERLRALFDQQLEAMEGLNALDRGAAYWDSLAKAGCLIEKWEGMEARARKQALEEAARVIDEVSETGGMTKEALKSRIKELYGV